MKYPGARTTITHRSTRRLQWLLLIIVGWTLPAVLHAQRNADIDPSFSRQDKNLAPVKFQGEVLFYVKGVSSHPADERAYTINRRIRKATARITIPPDSIRIVHETGREAVYAGNEFIMNVFEVDAEAEGVSLSLMGEIVRLKLVQVFKTYHLERSPEMIKASIWRAVGAAVITILSLLLFSWLMRRLKTVVRTRITNKADIIKKISFKLIQPDQLIGALRSWYNLFRSIIMILIVLIGVSFILSLFPWTKGVSVYILDMFMGPLRQASRGFLDYLPKLFFLIVIIILTRFVLNVLKLFFNGLQQGAIVIHNFYADWAMPAFQIIRFMVIILAVVMAFPYIPFSDTGAFQGISVFVGLLLSLGSSSFISNIIAGYSMTFRRAFMKGDRIKINDTIGTVETQSLMVTRLRSVKNEEIVIPNSVLINTTVVNYTKKSKNPGIILHTTVGIGYDTPWRQVEAMLIMAADRTEGLLKDPPPFVLQRALGDFAVTYEINAYCTDAGKILHYYSKLHENILDVFNEYNVQIMTPNYESDPNTLKVVSKENWNMPPTNPAGEISTTTVKE